jgi:hypothetical protein
VGEWKTPAKRRALPVALAALVGSLLAVTAVGPAGAQGGETTTTESATTTEAPTTTETTEAPTTTEVAPPTTATPPPTEAPAQVPAQATVTTATPARPRQVATTTTARGGPTVPTTLLAPVATVAVTSAPPPTTTTVPTEVLGATVEKVTTTENKVRRVVIGLVAIGVVSAALTIAFALHTSPHRRLARAGSHDEARARRLAAADAVARLGFDVRDPRGPAAEAASTNGARRVAPPAVAPPAVAPPTGAPRAAVAPRPEPQPARRRNPRPDPRPRPRGDT